jgi:hypothetical protein
MECGITLSNEKIYTVHTQYGCTVHYAVPIYVPIDLSIYLNLYKTLKRTYDVASHIKFYKSS